MRRSQSGQVMVLVAVSLLALIGSAALVLLAGSVEWQKNQLQQLADQTALDSALKIGIGCDAAKASNVITEADNFLATQRTRTGSLAIAGGSCIAPYTGTDTFGGGLSATYHYPYLAHQQQVEVILTLTLPIAFGAEVGKTTTSVVRRAVAQQLAGSVPSLSATTLACSGGQVNVAGSVATQNLIALSGSCAIYAHNRFDAASATYSDLGNLSAYADGQAWTGTCVASLNIGSTNALCADGFELSGHIAPSCGPAGTSFLSPGGKTVNPNPCAAGTGPQPVAPLSTNLPPEPNTDPVAIATLQGTGGAACSAGATYPSIVVNGVTVGTGLGPAPLADASGYYHFKPSCYGYLNLTPLSAGISKVQVGPIVTAKHFITPKFPVPTTAGTLLVATVRSDTTPTRFLAPAGWLPAGVPSQSGTSPRTEIWYYPNNPGAVPDPTFTITPANIDSTAQVSEWRNVATVLPLDQTGNFATGANQLTATVSTGGATAAANELVITNDGVLEGVVGQTLSNPAGWSSLANDPTDGFSSEYRLDLPAAIASETVTASVATNWALVVATFKGSGAGSGAVLDPGFYYFNGSGFPGGGGICLNGGTLLARDVTLEFVNQAGFSSGTCAPGGGAGCAATCQFGSPPCSLQVCPPNAGADSPNNLTWFAAPCSNAPSGDAASCPGSSWCLPAGDRSCSNVLIWAPASNTGQIAIVGAAAKHWLLGSVYWPGTCTDTVNGTSTIAGSLFCGSLTISAGAGAAIAVGGDYGIATSLVEAVLIE
jgi:hypothetical protein